MKKIINGKKYDTNTATLVYSRNYGGISSFDYFSETLYRKKTGEYFLYGEGNAASPYREFEPESNAYGSGASIKPMNQLEAKRWCEEYVPVEVYENEFGEVEE